VLNWVKAMCLIPFGGRANILIPPTQRARQIAVLLRMAIALHFMLVVMLFLSTRYVDGAFDVLGALVGFFSIRNSEGYSLQQVLCYTIFCAMDFFWSCLRIILYFSGAQDAAPDDWQFWVFIVTLTLSPFLYILCSTTSYYLYKELRTIVTDLQQSMMEGLGGGAAYGYNDLDYDRGGAVNPSIWSQAEANPSGYPSSASGSAQPAAQASGFRPFSGQGHRL